MKNPDTNSGNKPTQKRKGRGGGRTGGSRFRAQNVLEFDGEGESGSIGKFDVRVLFSVLERLELVLGLIHLDRFPDSLKALVQTVVEITVIGLDSFGNSGSYGKLCELSEKILVESLRAEHGDQLVSATEVLKCLGPSILFLKSQARMFALGFVIGKMIGMGKYSVEIKTALANFLKYLVNKAPEKAEPRAAAVESIIEIVKALEFDEQVGFVDHLVQMSRGKSHLRLLCVDLFIALMMTLKDPFGVQLEDGFENSWGLRCLDALIQRCSDKTAGIRARALSNLAQLVGNLSKNDGNCVVLKKVMAFDSEHIRQQGTMSNLLRQRCVDDKAAVRKAALLLTSKLTGLSGGAFDGEVLKTMGMSCSDPLVSIRKAAISALSEVSHTYF